MEPCIRASGILRPIREMDVGFRFGQMVRGMMDFGKMAWRADTDAWCTQRVMFTKEPGMRIRPMALEFIFTLTAPSMKVTGRMISKMDKAWRAGKTAADMREDTRKE